jgi:hypothetical protein
VGARSPKKPPEPANSIAEKSPLPEDRPAATDSATLPTRKRKRRVPDAGLMGERVPSKPSQWTELLRERAEKLATLRRGWLDEFCWAAIGGLAASIPSAAHSVSEIVDKKATTITFPQAMDFGVLLIFATLTLAALISRKRGPTSLQYLEQHYGPDPSAPKREGWTVLGWNIRRAP